jgi:molecular chaperone GrpE
MSKHDPQDKDREGITIEIDRGAKAAEPAGDPTPTAEKLAALQAERDELMQTMVRRQADFENYRKRIERERQEEGRRGAARLLEDVVPVLDAFERALRAHDNPAYEEYRKGLELIYRQLWDALARHGLERIAAAGKPFDPNFHQAIERVETSEHPDGTIVEVLQDGFMFHGRVLRPSVVRVAVAPGDSASDKASSAHRAN